MVLLNYIKLSARSAGIITVSRSSDDMQKYVALIQNHRPLFIWKSHNLSVTLTELSLNIKSLLLISVAHVLWAELRQYEALCICSHV